LVKRLVN